MNNVHLFYVIEYSEEHKPRRMWYFYFTVRQALAQQTPARWNALQGNSWRGPQFPEPVEERNIPEFICDVEK